VDGRDKPGHDELSGFIMVAYKTSAVPAFVRSPDPSARAMLVYGPDAGLVSERAAALADKFVRQGKGDAEIVRLDDRDLAEDPARIEVELRTRPMFSAGKVVRVTAGARLDVPSLKALLAAPFDHPLIVEAGNLRPDSGLRKLFEANKAAAALPCYSDERTLAALIEQELSDAGLRIDTETKTYLLSRLGADQALSRAEVAKLALYAAGASAVNQEDIDAVVGDAAEIALENFVYAGSGGNPGTALAQLQRLSAAGTDVSSALSALGRHFTQLHRVATMLAEGSSTDQALRALRPRPHFKREPEFLAHAKKWGARRLADALPQIQEAIRRTRLQPEFEAAFAERLLLTLTSKTLASKTLVSDRHARTLGSLPEGGA
jgi:DNA polymerase-3 subunit delta